MPTDIPSNRTATSRASLTQATSGSRKTVSATPAKKTPAKKAAPRATTVEEYIATNYGFLAGFLAIPEIRKILTSAAAGKWTPAKLQGAVYATKWWKTTAEVTRNWTALESTDPAEARNRTNQTRQQIQSMVTQAGLVMSGEKIGALARNILKYGWTEQQVQAAIGHEFKYDPEASQRGQAALTVDRLKAVAADYLVPLSDTTIQKWGQDVLSGTVDVDAFTSYAKEQARSLFPGLSAALDAGVTVAQYVEPYKQIAAQTLEIPQEQVTWTDPKWRRAVDQIDPKTGIRTSMSLSDWQKTLRTDPVFGYDKTQQAREQAAGLASRIAERFGAI